MNRQRPPAPDTDPAEFARMKAELARLRQQVAELGPSLTEYLDHRGFDLIKEPSDRRYVLTATAPFRNDFARMLGRYSFRLFLRDLIGKGENVPVRRTTKFISAEVYADYLQRVRQWGLVVERAGRLCLARAIPSFGPTLEWWVARLLSEDLGFETLRGVRFRGRSPGGDYDVLARVENRLLYLEAKSSPPKQVTGAEIDAFLDRVSDLRPGLAVFFMDTELRMKDKILPMFQEALRRRGESSEPFARLVGELFQRNHRLYVVNARGGVGSNLRRVVADHLRHGFS